MDDKEELIKFVEMFDTAMNSNNPSVRKCFSDLMIVVALVHSEEHGKERIMGPLTRLVKKIDVLESDIQLLKLGAYNTTGQGYVPPNTQTPYVVTTPYTYNTTGGYTYNTNNGGYSYTTPNTITTSTTAI